MTRQRQYIRFAVFFTITITVCMLLLFGQANVMPIPQAEALGNGLARTPPMGWNSWNKFGCNVTDALVRQMADAMVSSGMAAAGYQYINVDDCWQGSGRTNGHVNLDPDFPNMKALADYVHSKGLKFGLYSDRGTNTCAGRVGSHNNETTDANDYAAWGVDYLKYDNCNADSDQQADYERMRNALANSGRPIVFSICAWQYQSWMPATGNLWRTTGDIADNWNSMWGIPNTNNASASVAGPGAWNDPDMLEIGNGGMSDTEYRTHMGWWAIMAAPLIAGNDLRSMSQATKDILMAPEIVAVDQDSLGVQGTRVWDDGNSLNIWSKRINGTNTRAVFLVNGRSSAASITVSWSQIGLPSGNATVRDLWTRTDLGTFNNSYTASSIPAHGSRMLKIVSGSSTCTPTAITPYVQINGGAWVQTSTASVNVGASVKFGPQPVSGGSWKWTGPNGFSATSREVTISNIQTNQAGNYVATYTNSGGCNSTQTFTVTVAGAGPSSYEAEAGARSGAAVIASCSACSGGQKVGYIGNGSANTVTLTVNASSAGSRTMTVYYTLSGSRSFYVSVNSGAGVQLSLSGSSWTTPASATMTVTLNAGSNTIKFYNNSAYAPDLDRIVIQ